MAQTYDAIEELTSMISGQWQITNTLNLIPNIGAIEDYPREFQFADKKGYILLYSISEREEMPGVGQTMTANITERIAIDIRVSNNTRIYYNKIKAELRRILYSNRQNPTPSYHILFTTDNNIQSMSNRARGLYREVRHVDMWCGARNMIT